MGPTINYKMNDDVAHFLCGSCFFNNTCCSEVVSYLEISFALSQMSHRAVEQNYFTCTLGQAAELNAKCLYSFQTINQFLDAQNTKIPDAPAVGFPLPALLDTNGGEWDYEILCGSYIQSKERC